MIVVTGSDGFVGRHLVSALSDEGEEVWGADIRTGTDLTSRDEAFRIEQGQPNLIIHLAGSCSTPGSISDPVGTFRNTVITAVNMLELARRLSIPIIITSSVKARDGKTPYGAAKRMVELWAAEYADAYGLTVVINRPGTIYGPGQAGSPESGWIAWFCKARDEGKRVTINGDGSAERDLLHVSDYVRLLMYQAIDPVRYRDTIWDVGGGELNTVTVRQIADHLGLKYEFGPERYGDSQRYVGINDVPGWQPWVNWWESDTLSARSLSRA